MNLTPFCHYRNTDKSHAFEHETEDEAQPVTGSDRKIDDVHGTRRTEINGNNVREYRTRVEEAWRGGSA